MSEVAEAVLDAPAEPSIEERARDMGWRPKEEFKGDEAKWVDAETFVQKGEEVLPIVRANAKKLEVANEALKAELAEMRSSFKDFKKYHSQTEQRALEKARRELEREMAEAVEAKDHKAVREIAAEMADLSKDVRTDGDGNPYETPEHTKALSAWKSDNAWFGSDKVMTLAANVIADELEAGGVKGAEQLAEVAKRIRSEFPHKFENERRKQASAVEGSTPQRKAGKTRADLPAEARAHMDKWVKQGLLTEAQFLKDYQWDTKK
jgi:hypothetical protein